MREQSGNVISREIFSTIRILRFLSQTYSVRSFDPHNLFFHRFDILKGLVIGETVTDDEALAVFDIQISHGGELFCTGRIEDFQYTGRAVHLDFFAVKILNGRVIFLHEVTGDKLHCQGGLAHAPGPQDHNLELLHDRWVIDQKASKFTMILSHFEVH